MHILKLSRYSKFTEMNAKGDVKLGNLLPTDSTSINHSLRVQQQTITRWKCCSIWSFEIHHMQLQIVEKNVSYKSMYMQKIWFKMCSGMWQM